MGGWVAMLLVGLGACSDRSPGAGGGTGGNGGTGGTSGTGGISGTGGVGGTGGGAGTFGMPEPPCTSDGATCAPTERCVPDVFEPPRTFPAGTAPADLVLRDVNGDAHLDAVVVHGTGKSVLTLLGGGDGAFAAPVYSVVSGGSDLAVADFDGDGRLDVVVPSIPTVIGFGAGDGTFTGTMELAIEARFVAAADVNADEALDLVTLALLPRTVQVHLGDGRGAFTSGEPFEVSEEGSAKSLALVDLDGDAVLDLVVGNLDVETLSVSRGNGDGTFAHPMTFATEGGDPWALSFADWNSDGNLDVATANDYIGSVSVLLGASVGTFEPAQVYPTGLATNSVVAEDFDRDGNLDLLAAHLNPIESGIDPTEAGADTFFASFFRGTGTGSFDEPRAFTIGPATLAAASSLFNLATGDVNEDGRVDVVATNYPAENVAVLLGTPFGQCAPRP